MGIFSKKKKDGGELNAFLGVGTEYKGKLDFVGTVRIDGRFEGEISTDGDLVLGRKANIVGKVTVGRLTSCGRIEGTVTVREMTVLEKTATLIGSLSTPALSMDNGAVLQGDITMTQDGASARPKVVSANFGSATIRPATGPDHETSATVAKTGSDDSA